MTIYICPFCGEELNSKYDICSHCGQPAIGISKEKDSFVFNLYEDDAEEKDDLFTFDSYGNNTEDFDY